MASTTTSPPPAGGTTSNVNCSACAASAPRPHLTCFECTEGVDVNGDVDPIQYCTAHCRDLAAADHKSECEKRNVRKQIYRAGELLQSVFYRSQDLNYLAKITWAGELDGIVYYSLLGLQHRTAVFETSPYKVISDVNSARALMSVSECTIQLSMQFEFSQKLLKGIVKYIEEFAIDVDDSLLKVRLIFANGQLHEPHSTHQVLGVETYNGEAYMIDVTGAQFGQTKAVLPLQKALDYYGKKVNLVWPHGHYRSELPDDIKEQLTGGIGANARDWIIPMFLAGIFDKHLAAWEAAHGGTVGPHLNASALNYEQFRSAIYNMVLAASVEGRRVLKKVAPADLVSTFDVAADFRETSSKLVLSVIWKDYSGSQIGKACHNWCLERAKQNDPTAWERELKPLLEGGGGIKFIPDREYKKRAAIAKNGRADNNPDSISERDKWGHYWAHRTLDG